MIINNLALATEKLKETNSDIEKQWQTNVIKKNLGRRFNAKLQQSYTNLFNFTKDSNF